MRLSRLEMFVFTWATHAGIGVCWSAVAKDWYFLAWMAGCGLVIGAVSGMTQPARGK